MSNVIKLKRTKGLNVQLLDDVAKQNFHIPSAEEIMKKKVETAFQEGFEQGRQEALKQIEPQRQKELSEAYKTVENIQSLVESKLELMERQFANDIFNLALQLSEKIIRREIELDTTLVENVKLALNKITGASKIVVKINPEEEELITKALSKDVSQSFNKVSIEPDERIQKGECTVESELGNVDLRVSSQLDEIEKHFQTYFERR